jgi:hypothetical protein
MIKLIFKIVLIICLLAPLSCELTEEQNKEDFDGETIVFINFAPQAVVELIVYNTKEERINGVLTDVKNEIVQTHVKEIQTYDYFAFNLPVSVLRKKDYFLEVKTEDGNVYGSSKLSHSGIIYDHVFISVDYRIYEYER